MPTTVMEMSSAIIADDSLFIKTLQNDEALLRQFGANSSGLLSPLNASFQSAGAAAETMGVITQTASQTVVQATITMGNAVASTVPAFQSVASSAGNMGQAVDIAAKFGSEAMREFAPSIGNVSNFISALKSRIDENKATIAPWTTEIAATRGQLAQLANTILQTATDSGAGSNAVRELRTQYAQLQAALRLMTTEQATFTAENRNLNTALATAKNSLRDMEAATRAAGTAQVSTSAATTATEQSTKKAGDATGFWTGLLQTNTSQLTTQHSILTGYDAIIQAVLRSFGGIPVIWAAAAGIGLQLISVFSSHKKAKEEDIVITDALVNSDIQLANALIKLSGSAGEAANKIREQAGAFSTLSEIDINSMFVVLSDQMDKYITASNKSRSATELWSSAQQQADDAIIAFKAGVDSAAESGTYYTDVANRAKEVVTKETAERDKQNGVIDKTVESFLKLVDSGRLTTAGMLNLAQATSKTQEAFNIFQAKVLDATSALISYTKALQNLKISSLDVKSTSEGLTAQFGQLQGRLGELEKAGKSQSDIMIANKTAVEAYTKGIKEKIAADAAATGKVLTHAEAEKQYSTVIKNTPGLVGVYANAIEKADKSMQAFTDSHKKGGGTAKATHAAISDFKDGLLGFDSAVTKVLGSTENLSGLFDKVSAKARQGSKDLTEALKVVTAGVNEYLQSLGLGVKATDAQLAAHIDSYRSVIQATEDFKAKQSELNQVLLELAKDGFTVSIAKVNEWAKSVADTKKEVVSFTAEALARMNQAFPELTQQINNNVRAFEYVQGKIRELNQRDFAEHHNTIEVAIYDWLRLSEGARSALEQMGVNVEIVFAKIVRDVDAFTTAASKSVSENFKPDWGAFKDAYEKPFDDYEKKLKAMMKANEEFEDSVRRSLGDGVGSVVLKLSGIFGANRNSVEKWSKDVGNLIDKVPGHFGDAIRKVRDTINGWLEFANSILKILSNLNSSIPNSLGGVIQSIIGIFKGGGASSQVGDAIGGMVTQAGKAGADAAKKAGEAAGGAVSGGVASGITAGTSGAVSAITGVLGAITAAVGVFASTFHDDSKAVRFAGGFLLGGPVGGILAAIFGGPSDFEKQKRSLQIDQLKANIASTYEDIKQSMIKTMEDGAKLLETLQNYSQVPKKAMRQFFNQLTDVLMSFVEMSKEFKPEALAAGKAVTDNLGDAFSFMLSALELLKSLDGTKAVAAETVKILMDFIRDVEAGWEVVAGEIETGLAKRSAKIADKLKTSFEFIKIIPDTIKAVIETPDLAGFDLNIIFDGAKTLITRMVDLADSFAEYSLTKTAKIAGKFTAIIAPLKDALDIFKSLADFTPVSDDTLQAVTDDFGKVLNWMDGLITLGESGITKAETLQSVISRMAAALKSATSSISSLASGIGGGTSAITFSRSDGVVAADRFGNTGGGLENVSTNAAPVVVNFYATVAGEAAMEQVIYKAINKANRRGTSY